MAAKGQDAPDLEAAVSFLAEYPMFHPTLWVPHCIIMCCALRAFLSTDDPDGWRRFSRRHPLSCAILGLVYVFPGGIVASVLSAEPPLAFLASVPMVAPAAVAWYLVFYAPFDFFYKFVTSFGLMLPFGATQDFLRIQLVQSGVDAIAKSHPGAFLYAFVFAACKSSGFVFIKYAEQVSLKGASRVAPLSIPNAASKMCTLSALAMAANANGLIAPAVDRDLLFATCGAAIIGIRFLDVLTGLDPFKLVEAPFCAVAFGSYSEESEKAEEKKAKAKKTQ